MSSAETASDPNGPRYAPDDPTLPAPWKGLIDGSTGILYYWNPDTNVTQYERPAVPGPPLPLGPPPIAVTPKLSPIPTAHNTTQNQTVGMHQPSPQINAAQHLHQEHPGMANYAQGSQMGQPQQQMSQPQQQMSQPQQQMSQLQSHLVQTPGIQQMPQQQPPLRQFTQQHPPQQGQHLPPHQQQQMSNQQLPPQHHPNIQMPFQQFPFPQGPQQPGLQFSYQAAQQPHMPPAPFNDGLQQHGTMVPQNQQNQPQSHITHPQGLLQQINPRPVQMNHGGQFSHQPGHPPHSAVVGTQQGQPPQGQEASFSKVDAIASHEGAQHGFSAPFSHQPPDQRLPSNNQVSDVHPSLNMQSGRSPNFFSRQPFGGSSPNDANTRFINSSAQLRQGANDARHQHQQGSGFTGLPHPGPSPTRPPVGMGINEDDDRVGKMKKDFHPIGRSDVPNIASHPPNLAPIPLARSHQDARMGPPFVPLNHHEYNKVLPPHPEQTVYSSRPFPDAANVHPSARMFGAGDFPDAPSADAYCQQHEVTAIGENVPPPLMTFEDTGFPPEILREIHLAGFLAPTPIQAQTWPVALQNRDIVAIAKTGSGKTLGYLIPAFIHLRRCRNNPQIGPTVLVLAPTRELATQIQDEAIKFGHSSRISCTCLSGGNSKGQQLRELERGADIVVATPGRLNDILEMKKIDFRQVSLLVLDEADRMLDMGFEPQIRKIVNEIPPNRQTLMYTATWPKEVRKIAGDLLKNPVQVNIGSIDELVANKAITQYIEVVPPPEKERRLEQILRSQERGSRIIIFCSTKRLCDQLARGIGRAFGAAAIHGDKSQAERDHVLNQFRTGKAPILVATDVAARGLDIKDIRVVINYDFPTGIEDYVHRIGRTGRAGATGVAYTFFSEQDWKHAADLIKVLEGAEQPVPQQIREMAARSGPPALRYQVEGTKPFDMEGGRFEVDGGMRDSPGGYGRREVPSGFGERDGPGPGGFGVRDVGGGFGGRDSLVAYGGRGAPGVFGGRGGPGGFGGRDGPSGFGVRDGPGGFGGRDGPPNFGGRDASFGGRRDGPGGYGGRETAMGYGGRDGPASYGGRDAPGGFGRDGPGSSGFGGRGGRGGYGGRGGPSPGGYGGRGGRGDSFGGRGHRGRGFQGGPMGRGRSDRGPGDRYLSDGRGGGRFGNRRGFGDRGRGRSVSRSPDRVRGRSYDRSRSRSRSRGRSYSRSRSRSRSWSRSRSRSRSYSRSRSRSSRSRSYDAAADVDRRPRRASLFDVPPPDPQACNPAVANDAAANLPGPVAPAAIVLEAAPALPHSGENGLSFSTGGSHEGGGVAPDAPEPVDGGEKLVAQEIRDHEALQ